MNQFPNTALLPNFIGTFVFWGKAFYTRVSFWPCGPGIWTSKFSKVKMRGGRGVGGLKFRIDGRKRWKKNIRLMWVMLLNLPLCELFIHSFLRAFVQCCNFTQHCSIVRCVTSHHWRNLVPRSFLFLSWERGCHWVHVLWKGSDPENQFFSPEFPPPSPPQTRIPWWCWILNSILLTLFNFFFLFTIG